MTFFNALFGGGSSGGSASAKAHEMVQAGAVLVDVRSPGEYAGGHLPNARNIPVDQIQGRMGELDKGTPVVVYCRSGARSEAARGLLAAAGYTVHNLGPMSAW